MQKITKDLVEFVHSIKYRDLEEDNIDFFKKCFLDFLGVASRGILTNPAKAVLRHVELTASGENYSILGTNVKTKNPQSAAFVNGVAAHSIELDDVHEEASLHPGAVIFPAALAIAELHPDFESLLLGVVVGYETMVRLGIGLRPEKHYERGFHPTGTCGVFGATATASKMLNFNKETTLNAFGIAGSMASGLHEYHADGSWTKRLHAGLAANNGLVASSLAKEGFTGPSSIIEGRDGFLRAFSNLPAPDAVCDKLGATYVINDISFKVYACCRYIHAPIDGILELINKHAIAPDSVKNISLGILDVAFPIIVEPHEVKVFPPNTVAAQFSMPYCSAVAVIKQQVSVDEFSEENLMNEQIRELSKKVHCYRDPELDKLYPKQWPAHVKIETISGNTFTTYVNNPSGSPSKPLSWKNLEDKFVRLTINSYSQEKQKKIINLVKNLEYKNNIQLLLKELF